MCKLLTTEFSQKSAALNVSLILANQIMGTSSSSSYCYAQEKSLTIQNVIAFLPYAYGIPGGDVTVAPWLCTRWKSSTLDVRSVAEPHCM